MNSDADIGPMRPAPDGSGLGDENDPTLAQIEITRNHAVTMRVREKVMFRDEDEYQFRLRRIIKNAPPEEASPPPTAHVSMSTTCTGLKRCPSGFIVWQFFQGC